MLKLFILLSAFILQVFSYGTELVINFQTDAGGSTTAADNSAAFVKATSLSASTGYIIYVPPGTYSFTRSINSTSCIVRGAGPTRSIFQWTTQLGKGVAAYEIYGPFSQVHQMGFTTPYGRAALGQYNANFYGLRLNDAVQLWNLEIQTFYAGIVWNSANGHTTSEYIKSSNNYYGIYVQASNGDNFITMSGLDGNTMASVGIPSTTSLGAGDAFFRVHMCFSPYGIYQEGPAGTGYQTFMFDTHFQLARFESCGNGAIYTENAGTGAYGGISDVELYNVGFSWNPSYRITSRNWNYAVNVGTTQQTSYYMPGIDPFTKGNVGTWNLNQANTWGGVQAFNSSPIVIN